MTILNTLKFGELQSVLLDYIQHPPRVGCLGIIGAPGTAKTDGVEAAVQFCGKELSYVNAPLVGPGEMLGVGFPSEDRKWTDFLPSRLVAEDSVLFFDELTNAERATTNILNRVLLNGELYGRRFRQARMFACNPDTVSEMADPLAKILINKSSLVWVDYRYDDFLNFALNDGHDRIHPIIASFVAETRDRYLQVKAFTPLQHDGVETPMSNEPFASPRGFELLTDSLRRVESGRVPYDAYKAAYSTVGYEAGKAFGDYYTTSAYLPSIQRIIAGHNERFPEKAYMEDGRVMSTLQVMSIYMVMACATSDKELANGCEWVFESIKGSQFGRELLRVFVAAMNGSRFRTKFSTVCRRVGEKVFGEAEYKDFMRAAMQEDVVVGVY